jgi:hypothetical protein
VKIGDPALAGGPVVAVVLALGQRVMLGLGLGFVAEEEHIELAEVTEKERALVDDTVQMAVFDVGTVAGIGRSQGRNADLMVQEQEADYSQASVAQVLEHVAIPAEVEETASTSAQYMMVQPFAILVGDLPERVEYKVWVAEPVLLVISALEILHEEVVDLGDLVQVVKTSVVTVLPAALLVDVGMGVVEGFVPIDTVVVTFISSRPARRTYFCSYGRRAGRRTSRGRRLLALSVRNVVAGQLYTYVNNHRRSPDAKSIIIWLGSLSARAGWSR